MDKKHSTSVKLCLRQIKARGLPHVSLRLTRESGKEFQKMREAFVSEDRETLQRYHADPLVLAELEIIKGNLKSAFEWIKSSEVPANRTTVTAEDEVFWRAWLQYRIEGVFSDLLPQWLVELETGIALINRGQPQQGISLVQNVLLHAFESGIVLWDRALSAWTYALMHLGYFMDANACVRWQLSSLGDGHFATIVGTSLRRQAVVFYFQRNFEKSAHSLDALELNGSLSKFNRLMAMNLKLNLALEQGQGFMAQGIVDQIAEQRRQMQVRPEALQPHELECFHRFARGKSHEALIFAKNWLLESKAHEDRVGEFSARIFVGLLSALDPKLTDHSAIAMLGSALDMARQIGLRALLLGGLFRAAVAAVLLDLNSQAEMWLQEGITLAKKMDAKEWCYVLTNFGQFLSPQNSLKGRLHAWLCIVSSPSGFYRERVLAEKKLNFRVRGKDIALETYLKYWPEDVVIYSNQCSFIASKTKISGHWQIKTEELDTKTQLGKIASSFLNNNPQLSTKFIHNLVNSTKYLQHRHDAQVRTLVSQARVFFRPFGIDIIWNREAQFFERKGFPVYEIWVEEQDHPKLGRPRTRGNTSDEMLLFIREHGFVTTSNLSKHFGYTRQGLYPIIENLITQGFVKRVRLGNKSGVSAQEGNEL